MNHDDIRLELSFVGLSQAEEAAAAQQLLRHIASQAAEVTASVRQDKQGALDLGATIVLLFGTQAVSTLAVAVHAFLAQRGKSMKAEQVNADGSRTTIEIKGDRSEKETVEAVRALTSKRR